MSQVRVSRGSSRVCLGKTGGRARTPLVFPGLLSACGVAPGLSRLTDACVPRASDFNPTWLGSSFSTTSLQLLFGPCHAERGWPSKDPSEPYWEVKQKHFCVQRGLGGVGTAIPSPLFLQGAGTDCKMPQGCGAREEGAKAPYRVLAADTGGEGPLVGQLALEAGWLVGPHDTVFPTAFPQRVLHKGNGA